MLFNLAQTLRSFTASPVATAIDQAHRMARRRLEAGGSAASVHGEVNDHVGAADFVLPPDVDPVEVEAAIEAKLHGGRHSLSNSAGGKPSVLELTAGGLMIVPRRYIWRLGDGALDRGKRVLDRIIENCRTRQRRRDY